MRGEFDKKLAANMAEVKAHGQAGEVKVKAVEEMLKQTEEDADKEIIELKTRLVMPHAHGIFDMGCVGQQLA